MHQRSLLSNISKALVMWICCVARCLASDSLSFPMSVKAVISESHVFQIFHCCNLCFDLFILILVYILFAFSAVALALQLFTCKWCSQITKLRVHNIMWNLFLIKNFKDRFTWSPFWRLVTCIWMCISNGWLILKCQVNTANIKMFACNMQVLVQNAYLNSTRWDKWFCI